jgi:hypothetical protein
MTAHKNQVQSTTYKWLVLTLATLTFTFVAAILFGVLWWFS